jgi:folylpolyglutamate synthase/dihydropteroate synthase
LSTREASLWFSESSGISSLSPTDNIRSVLIFNCGLDKDTVSILHVLTKLNFDTIIFVPTAGGISAPPTQSKNTPSTHHPLSALAALERYKMSTRNINNKDISVSDSDFINVEALEERLTPSLAIDRDDDNVLQDALHWQKSLAQLWKALREEGGSKRERSSSESNVYVETSAESALTRIFIESSGERPSSHIFVTGSLYLVGDVLRTLQTK